MTAAAINPDNSVQRKVTKFQLRAIIERATAGGYGADSAAILERSRKQLAELSA